MEELTSFKGILGALTLLMSRIGSCCLMGIVLRSSFTKIKSGDPFESPKFAFTKSHVFGVSMPKDFNGNAGTRQCAIMINRMHDQKDKPRTATSKRQKFSFDILLRVKYQNSTNGVTITIDPGGDNPGPPSPPPVLP